MKKNITYIVIAFLLGAAGFIGYRYYLTVNEKQVLVTELKDVKGQVESLSTEKQNLLQDLGKEKESNKALSEENLNLTATVSKMDADFAEAQKSIEGLNSQLSLMKAENADLRANQEAMQVKLTNVTQERDMMSARLSSLTELKKTIRDLKVKMWQMRLAAWRSSHPHTQTVINGNKGYFVKDGKLTLFPEKISIEVVPADAH